MTVPYTPVTNNDFLNFGTNVLNRNDDGSSSAIDITSIFQTGIRIGNVTYTSMYVNNNGNITFGNGLSAFTPGVIGGSADLNIIAPFWADVDTRVDAPAVNDGVYWDFNAARDSIVITWNDVGYYYQHGNLLNSFQMELRDRGGGAMEIIFRYDDIQWTTGDASGGTGGIGGTIARGGFSLGNTYFELPSSGYQGPMLSLEMDRGNLGVAGVWQFVLQNGRLNGFGTDANNTYVGTIGSDSWFGLGGNDTISGLAGNDFLYGGAGNDTIRGGAGNDMLDAGSGTDTMRGEAGNDTYVTDGGDTIIELANGGIDTVRSLVTYTLGANLENLVLIGANPASGYGNALANTIMGNTAGNALSGMAGNDRLFGGGGSDTALYSGAVNHTVSLAVTTAQNTGEGLDILNSIENLTGGAARDVFIGNAAANVLNGVNGNDSLAGMAGNDKLFGGTGIDTLNGGLGTDLLYGGVDAVRDVFLFSAIADSAPGSAHDVIYNFVSGTDDISLTAIDANASLAGNQAFAYGGTTARANGIWYQDTGNDLVVSADVNGDAVADFEILIVGINTLVMADFLL